MQFLPIVEEYLDSLSDSDIVGVCGDGDDCLVSNAIKYQHPEYESVSVDCNGTVYADDDLLEIKTEYADIVYFFDHISSVDDLVIKKQLLENAEYRAYYALSYLFDTIRFLLHDPVTRVRLGVVTEEEE